MPESTVHTILAAVERLAPQQCGAFVVEINNDRVGSVFVERNQVCWAAYTGLGRRLRDLLRDNLARAIDDAEIDRAYRDCSVEGKHLGEELVSRDYVKAEAMRRALKQHTIESLVALPQEQGEKVDWVAHRAQGYQPRFTFSPAELLVSVNSMLYANEAVGAEVALSLVDLDSRAASYVPSDSGGLVAIRMIGPRTTIADIDELGAWAEAAFGITRGFSHAVIRRAIEAATGEMCVAWQSSKHHTHAAVVERGLALDRLVSTLEGRNFPAVVSRRAPRSSLAVRDGLGAVVISP